ncbi:Hint domain-containing protein [Dehalogenimonas sp. THU2]|uniref:Hint domain-containing protein n=1 Tax=Dehalogenimonas sp. THU2 TaxID=3151121 RepID=UPI003218BEFF
MAVTACDLPPSSSTIFTPTQLRYRLLDAFPDFFWCDPDFFPIGSSERELQNALDQFDGIRANDDEFNAIVKRIGLDHKLNYTTEEQLLVYRQHKLLTRAISEFLSSGDGFSFVIRVGQDGQQGERIQGNIATDGRIRVADREPSFNSCPICLAKGTLIDTPQGPVAVEDLVVGILVWTLDESGQQVAAPVIKTSRTPEPAMFQLLCITMEDGRILTASPGHPAADGRLLAVLDPGDTLDGAAIESIEIVDYTGRTYDILPGGDTGWYWADGILLASTLAEKP